mmetsp:Transcript_18552/g.34539  ORF Transcript_18552/g.34539 Transcript_18552/m.34539 type:complete len:309 (-) Transcript_18552:1300-2226(-)
MKYLENDKLNEISAELSEAVLGDSHRIIEGRIEAYTMKRAGNDKKYAHALGQKYLAEIEDLQEELAATVERRRKRSNSESLAISSSFKRSKSVDATGTDNKATGNNNNNSDTEKAVAPTEGRKRAQSYDFTLDTISPKTTLGDFSELSTRRLMTDLILTLNASFPDYDFSNVKPNQFHKLAIGTVRKSIYERLSELASQKSPNWLVELWCALNDVIDIKDCVVYSFENEIDDDNSLWSFNYFFVNKSLRRIVFFTCSEKIDEEELRSEEDDDDAEQVRYYNATAPIVDDFDWDPSDNVAGGISMEVAM